MILCQKDEIVLEDNLLGHEETNEAGVFVISFKKIERESVKFDKTGITIFKVTSTTRLRREESFTIVRL